MQGLERAWKALGSRGALAKALSISPSTISMWQTRGRIPSDQVLKVEQISGIPREQLRPDLYRKPSKSLKTK